MTRVRPGHPAFMTMFLIILMFGGITISKLNGWWITETLREPVSFTEDEYEGMPNPADIRGSFTLGDVAQFFDIPFDVLTTALSIRDAGADFRLNSLEGMDFQEYMTDGEFGTDSVKLFVARYIGVPFIADENTRLPASAVDLLADRLTPADIDALRSIAIELPVISAADISSDEHEEETGTLEVKGNTSFYDLLNLGVSSEDIERVLGMEMGPSSMLVRDFLLQNNMDYNTYKNALQELADEYQ